MNISVAEILRRIAVQSYVTEAIVQRINDNETYEFLAAKAIKLGIFYGAIWLFALLVVGFSLVQLAHHDRFWGHALTELGLGTLLLVLIPLTFGATMKEWKDKYDEPS